MFLLRMDPVGLGTLSTKLTKNISVGLETVSMLTWFETDWIIETITRYFVTHYGQMANSFLKREKNKPTVRFLSSIRTYRSRTRERSCSESYGQDQLQ